MTCRRCRKETDQDERFCGDCHYPGVEEAYNEYQALLDEGYPRIQAAVMSGWQDPVEAGAYSEDD